MLILALDTSGETCSVALSEGVKVIASYDFRHDRRLSERLNTIIAFLLSDTGHSISDVAGIGVGLGPGSFTGVRIGVTLAKTLAMVNNLPIVGVSSLSALVEPISTIVATPIIAVVPTRRTESIAAFFLPGTVEPLLPPDVYSNESLASFARTQFHVRGLLLLGEAAELVYKAAPADDLTVLSACPTASAVARLAAVRLAAGETDDVDSLVPLYIATTPVG